MTRITRKVVPNYYKPQYSTDVMLTVLSYGFLLASKVFRMALIVLPTNMANKSNQ